MKQFFRLVMILALVPSAFAQVWVDTQKWNNDWEAKFATWMQSSAVQERLFVDARSPYAGIVADCADAAYAFRAIFAYENGLPFAIRNPSGARAGQPAYANFNNRIDRFNYVRDPNKRVVAFLNYIGSSVGSENLTRNDTFPVAISQLRSGDMFSYRITARFNNFIRHVYNIKNINPTGSFDVIYSTQAIADKNLPMIRRREREFVHLPHDAWGFRRFRWPEYIGQPISAIPASLGNSNEQYDLVRQYGDGFFRQIKRQLSTITETPDARMKRAMNNLCIESQARIEFVDQGLSFMASINGRCMDYAQFDAYSTPARDGALAQVFERTRDTYQEILRNREDGQVSRQWLQFAKAIFNGERGSESELTSFCPITYKRGTTINLAELRARIVAGKLSSHPNDTVEHRWGEPTRAARTRCRAFY